MPCPDIRQQAEFYQALGFQISGLYTSPNPYVSLHWGAVELHFYGSRKVVPAANPTMCFVKVEDAGVINNMFANALKQHTGKIPRTGIPRISKVRDLVDDRRFTLTDPGGNTLYIGSPAKDRFFRSLKNMEYAKKFSALYDVLHSKEDPTLAAGMLAQYTPMKDHLDAQDKAIFLLLEMEILQQAKQPVDDEPLQKLIKAHHDNDSAWKRISVRYENIKEEISQNQD